MAEFTAFSRPSSSICVVSLLQSLVKRGLHTLKKADYQILVVGDGIATDEERNATKDVNTSQAIKG